MNRSRESVQSVFLDDDDCDDDDDDGLNLKYYFIYLWRSTIWGWK